MNKRFIFYTVLFFSAFSLFGQSWEADVDAHLAANMADELFRDFAVPNVHALAMATIYPAAWIGNMYISEDDEPSHFALSFLGSAAADLQILSGILNRFGGFTGLSLRMGGFRLPFDMGLAGIYLPPLKVLERDIWIANLALDLRYRIIRENEGVDLVDCSDSLWSVHNSWNFIPSLSFGIGAAYSHIGVNAMFYQETFFNALADAEIALHLHSYSFWWNIHLSKKLVFWDAFSEGDDESMWYINEPVFYLIPYAGIRLALGNGIVFGTENATITEINGLPVPPDTLTLHQKHENGLSFSPVVYAGVGIKLFHTALINIGVSYDLAGGVPGAQVTAGYSR